MKFVIETTNCEKPDKIIERYPQLNMFGLEKFTYETPKYVTVRDETGKRVKQYAGCNTHEACCIYIYTLEEFIELADSIPDEIIITKHRDTDNYVIEIYNGHRE